MMITLQVLADQVEIYFQKEGNQKKANQLAELIFRSMPQLPERDRRQFVQLLDAKFNQSTHLQSPLLLTTLSKTEKWRDSLLGSFRGVDLKIKYPLITYSNSGDKPMLFDERFKFSESKNQMVFSGSTFATNKKNRMNDNGSYLLDAAYSAECYKRSGDFSGFAFALADGAGGHLDDESQDKNIANAAYSATKSCVRFFSAYHQANLLKLDLPEILLSIKDKVNQKGKGESTTLLGCRAFIEKAGFRLIGFNIGDCMMVAWDPQEERLYQVPSQISAGAAMLPFAYRESEVHYIDQIFPHGTCVFLLSDGIHDLLAHSEKEGIYPDEIVYRTRHLTGLESLFKNISKKAPFKTYLNAIIQEVIQNAEKLRQQNLNQDVQMGDDATLVGIYLTQPGFRESVISQLKHFLVNSWI